MKSSKIFYCYLVIILFALVSSASALTDKEYRQLMKNPNFSQADKALNQAWTNAKNSLSQEDFNALKKSQNIWLKTRRDNEARQLLRKLSRVQAYTLVTNSRAEYINNYVKKRSVFDQSDEPQKDLPDESQSQNDLPDLPEDLPEDLPDVPRESPVKNETAKINLADSDSAAEYLTEKLIDSGRIQPNEEIQYLDSEIEINGVQCWEFSASFNFVETGRYAISQNGKIFVYQDEKYIPLN